MSLLILVDGPGCFVWWRFKTLKLRVVVQFVMNDHQSVPPVIPLKRAHDDEDGIRCICGFSYNDVPRRLL